MVRPSFSNNLVDTQASKTQVTVNSCVLSTTNPWTMNKSFGYVHKKFMVQTLPSVIISNNKQ